MNKEEFYNPTKGKLTFLEVIEEIFNYLNEKSEKSYEVIVGCDSGRNLSFPVAVVVLRIGFGGRFFLKKIKYPTSFAKRFKNIHERVLREVLLSCDLALKLREKLKKRLKKEKKQFNYQFKYIHADIGEEGRTKDMIREVVGLIKGNGFEPKIKPDSFVASIVADRYT